MRIGLLGGTFDPIHNGHLKLAQTAFDRLKLDKVLFIPAFMPPHKIDKKITPLINRYKMLELALRDYSFCEISDVELKQKNVGYTIDTLKLLHALYSKDTEFFFLVGSDFIHTYKTWKDYEQLFALAHFVVAVRPGYSNLVLPKGIVLLDDDFPDVSSTDIRFQISNHLPLQQLPEPVINYILEEKLYGVAQK